MARPARAGRAVTISGVRRRIGRLERTDGPATGLAETLAEAHRRAREGLPRRPLPSTEELSAMAPSLRGAWQRLIDARQRVRDHDPASG